MAKKKAEIEPTHKDLLMGRIRDEYLNWKESYKDFEDAICRPAEIFAMCYVVENAENLLNDEDVIDKTLAYRGNICQQLASTLTFHLEYSIGGELNDALSAAISNIELIDKPDNSVEELDIRYYEVFLKCTDEPGAWTSTCIASVIVPTAEQVSKFLEEEFKKIFPSREWMYELDSFEQITDEDACDRYDMGIKQYEILENKED